MRHVFLDGAVVCLAGERCPVDIVPSIDIADGYGGAVGFVPQIALDDKGVSVRVGRKAAVLLVAGEDFGAVAVAIPDIALILGFGYFCYFRDIQLMGWLRLSSIDHI